MKEILTNHEKILVLEQAIDTGGLYSAILKFSNENRITTELHFLGFERNTILPHGKIQEVLDHFGLSEESVVNKIKELK